MSDTSREAKPVSGWYIDQSGKRWFCVPGLHGMTCDGEDGYFTSAFFDTFKVWGWKLDPRETEQPSP